MPTTTTRRRIAYLAVGSPGPVGPVAGVGPPPQRRADVDHRGVGVVEVAVNGVGAARHRRPGWLARAATLGGGWGGGGGADAVH